MDFLPEPGALNSRMHTFPEENDWFTTYGLTRNCFYVFGYGIRMLMPMYASYSANTNTGMLVELQHDGIVVTSVSFHKNGPPRLSHDKQRAQCMK